MVYLLVHKYQKLFFVFFLWNCGNPLSSIEFRTPEARLGET